MRDERKPWGRAWEAAINAHCTDTLVSVIPCTLVTARQDSLVPRHPSFFGVTQGKVSSRGCQESWVAWERG